jgi:predicted metalloprotease
LGLVDFQYTLAHEYGHHLQAAVGILSMYNLPYLDAAKAVQLEGERRLELQASCLGAAFLGANKRAFGLTGEGFEDWEYLVKHYGDDNGSSKPIRDHGSRKSHGYWSLRAFDSASPASCNTFTAPAKLVS